MIITRTPLRISFVGDPPAWWKMPRGAAKQLNSSVVEDPGITAQSVVKGQPAGIEAGQYAPDFQLEPVDLYPQSKEWLGDKAPEKFEDKVMLSDLLGKKPIMLLFGSYT